MTNRVERKQNQQYQISSLLQTQGSENRSSYTVPLNGSGVRYEGDTFTIKKGSEIIVKSKINECETSADLLNCLVSDNEFTADKLQLTLNSITNEKVKPLLVYAVRELPGESRAEALSTIEASINDHENKIQLAANIREVYAEIVTDEKVTKDDAISISNIMYRNLNKDDVQEAIALLNNNAQEFYKQYGTTINELKEIRKTGHRELTNEENQLLLKAENCYEAQATGALTGIPINKNLSKDEQKPSLNLVNQMLNDTNLAETVYQSIAELALNNPEYEYLNSEEFISLMDEITNGKYSEIRQTVIDNIIKNNENAVIETSETNDSSNKKYISSKYINKKTTINARIAYSNITAPFERNIIQDTEDSDIKDENPKKTIVEIAKEGNFRELIQYTNLHGAFNTVLEIFSNYSDINNKAIEIHAQKLYSTLNPKQQKNILERMSYIKSFNTLINSTSNTTILSLDKCANYYMTEKVENIQEETLERTPNLKTCENNKLMA